MPLTIAQLGQPVLRQVATEVPIEEIAAAGFQKLLHDMRETMDESGGVGLGAPQVFLSQRVFLARILPPEARRALARRAWIGLVAGVAATAAYDVVRYGLVTLFSWSVDPFKAFTLFGALLVGRDASTAALWVAGTAYHILNGLGFAIGYTLVIRRPGRLSAVVWAMVLETFTILLYPDWLGIRAVGEFFSMSMLGHVAYGLVLGAVAIRMTHPEGTPKDG